VSTINTIRLIAGIMGATPAGPPAPTPSPTPGGVGMDATFAEPFSWRRYDNFFSNVFFAETYCGVSFDHQPSNNRIRVTFFHGDSSTPQVNTDVFVNYVGLTNITSIEVQYNVVSQSCVGDCNPSTYGIGPLPTSQGLNSGTYYSLPRTFAWAAQANPNDFQNNFAEVQADFTTANPDFRIRLVCDQGAFTSSCDLVNTGLEGEAIYLRANGGNNQPELSPNSNTEVTSEE
jgi:hypothetical protein